MFVCVQIDALDFTLQFMKTTQMVTFTCDARTKSANLIAKMLANNLVSFCRGQKHDMIHDHILVHFPKSV